MAYLDNSTITLDAVLTKKGRDLLSRGQEFKITQFALSDDEIDYSLWNSSHPSGSDSFGNIIENTPILEAITDEGQVMKYKLVSIPNVTTTLTRVYLPKLVVNQGDISANSTRVFKSAIGMENMVSIVPQTVLTITGTNVTDYSLDQTLGYTYLIGKSVSTLLNTNGLFTSLNEQISTDMSTKDTREDIETVERKGKHLNIKLRKEESDFPSTLDIPITITGIESGAIFEFILRIEKST